MALSTKPRVDATQQNGVAERKNQHLALIRGNSFPYA
jgi:hypothetical protein